MWNQTSVSHLSADHGNHLPHDVAEQDAFSPSLWFVIYDRWSPITDLNNAHFCLSSSWPPQKINKSFNRSEARHDWLSATRTYYCFVFFPTVGTGTANVEGSVTEPVHWLSCLSTQLPTHNSKSILNWLKRKGALFPGSYTTEMQSELFLMKVTVWPNRKIQRKGCESTQLFYFQKA